MEDLKVGTVVNHYRHGEGVVRSVNLTNYDIIFEFGCKLQISKTNKDIEVIDDSHATAETTPTMKLRDVVDAIELVMERYAGITHKISIGSKWTGGKLVMQPSNNDLKPKEVPIEAFFHKIVMVRDRLRVLEQSINTHPKLNDEERVHLQQYITRIYGSLTTFNILFANKEDYFVGQKGDE